MTEYSDYVYLEIIVLLILMVKFLPIAIVIILVVTVLSVRFILWNNSNQSKPLSNPTQPQTSVINSAKDLLSNSSGSTSSASLSPTPSLDNRVGTLESQVHNLQYNQGSTSSATASKPPTQFISLGSGGSATTLDYSTIPTYQITLDPSDFPGYTGITLEVSLSVYQGNGTAYARLIDSEDSQAIPESEVSTTSQDPVWLTSTSFKLLAGKKIYKMQLKTPTGYTASIENARLRVTY